MSLYGALYAGVAGLQAQSNKLGIISDNVANVNTVGYKQAAASFETLVTSSGGNVAYSPGGVLGGNEQLVSTQGLLQTTSSPTDIALSGNGFFIVNQSANQSGQVLYTRAGSFTQDAVGNFINTGGFYLQAWPLDHDSQLPGAPGNPNTISSANLGSLQTVNVRNLTGTASPTTSVSLSANFKASQAIFTGAGGLVRPDAFDATNAGIRADDIIVETDVNHISRDFGGTNPDKFSITTGAGVTSSYTYGGFTEGRDVTDPTSASYGDNGVPVQKDSADLGYDAGADLNTTAYNAVSLGSTNTSSNVTVTVSHAQALAVKAGDYISISGITEPFNNLTDVNGIQVITAVNRVLNTITYAATGTANATGNAGTTAVVTPLPIATGTTASGFTPVTISQALPDGMAVGDYVTIAGAGTVDGLTMNGTFKITDIDPLGDGTHFTVTVPGTATLGNTAGGTGTITVTPEVFATTASDTTITVYQPNHHYAAGDTVSFADVPASIGGVTTTVLNNRFVIQSVSADGNHYTIDVPAAATPTSSAGGGNGAIATLVSARTLTNLASPALDNASYTRGAGQLTTSGATDKVITITVTQDQIDALNDGDYVTISGLTLAINTIAAADLMGTYQIANVNKDARTFTYTASGVNTSAVATASAQAVTVTPARIATGATVSGHTPVTISQALPAGMAVGDYVKLSGLTGAVDGLTLEGGVYKITDVDPLGDGAHFTVDVAGTVTTGNTAGGAGTIIVTPQTFATTASSRIVTVFHPEHPLAVGDVVTFSSVPASIGGVSATVLNSSFVVQSVSSDGNHYTIQVPATATATSSDGGGNTTIATTRPFIGTVMDALNTTQTFLGTTGTTRFSASALTFSITSPDCGTVTFSYKASNPETGLKQFNNMTTLATAINTIDGLTARVVNGRLYVGASDATNGVTFENGSTEGVDGPPTLAGLDWIRELGLSPVVSAANRFSSMQSLAALVNATPGLSASITNPLGAATVDITLDDPLDTITFDDGSPISTNTGSLLAALGLVDSLDGDTYLAQSTGSLGPSYDPTDVTKNITSGAVGAAYSKPITIYDAQGYSHNLNISAIKVAQNTWAMEVYASAGDVDLTASLIASGTVQFNGDGSLGTISTSLTDPMTINWANQSSASTLSINWGTAGPIGTGKTNGISQFDSGFNTNSTAQNGAPVGKLTGVAIDSDGYIIASYNNGQTQKLYKIPVANFTNPNRLQAISGNTYAQTNDSGEVNLKEAGDSGVGKISSGALETSNVELANQLTDMIVAQRAYQANTKVISTADQLLSDLDQILR